MKIKTYIDQPNTISRDTSSINNWEEYIDYLNNEWIIPSIKDISKQTIIKSTIFGDVTVVLDTDIPMNDSDGTFRILVTMYDNRKNANEDEWYDKFADDKTFINALEQTITSYIDDLNNVIEYKHPWEESLVFHDGRLYMEINSFCPEHTPEFVKFSIDNHFIDSEELEANLYVYNEN